MFNTISRMIRELLPTRLSSRVLVSKALIDGRLLLLIKIMSKNIGTQYQPGSNLEVVSSYKARLQRMGKSMPLLV